MIRVTLGKMGSGVSASHVGERVMVVGHSLLVDGKRVARKSSWSSVWLDDFGRGWDTIDFHSGAPADASPTEPDEDGPITRGMPEELREQLERALTPKERAG